MFDVARKRNKYVPVFPTGEDRTPDVSRGYYGFGDESEAEMVADLLLPAWKWTEGAIPWLRRVVNKNKKQAPAVKGPLGITKKWLTKNLPQEADVWQAEYRQIPNWIQVAGEMVRPWAIIVASPTHHSILTIATFEDPPSADILWDTIVRAMQQPAVGEPHRPAELQVRSDERWQTLNGHLDDVGVNMSHVDDLELIDTALSSLFNHLCGTPPPGLLDMPGITAEQVASFYDAAAQFFVQMPWKIVGFESAMKIECDKFESGPWYGVLMGQSGLTAGLALYEDWPALQQVLAGHQSDEEAARNSVATTVTFDEEWQVPVSDLEAAMEHGWKIARSDAHPEIFHKERGLSLRRPLAWELELMEGCLRAVPDFVRGRKQGDPTMEEFTVPVSNGELKLVLSWMTEAE